MKSHVRASVCALLCLGLALSLTLPASAQVTRGSLAGRVTDEDGGTALPGAQVTAVHTPTGTRYSTVTDAGGRYRIINVRVGGPYRVTVTMDGFEPAELENAFVLLGEELNLDFRLQLAGVTEVITVVSESSPLINPGKTGAASNVGVEAIETLPSISRGLEDFARTNPFFVVQSDGEDPDNISIAGRSARYNNIQIDGAVNNDLFGLADQGTPGGQTNTTPISLDAIQEVELVLADYDVRQGGFSSGSVNAITRSGTNSFKGSAYYFTRDDGFVGDGPRELGDFGTFEEDNYGFRVGGPIQRDKAFFFFNFDVTDTTQPTGRSIDGSGGQAWANGDGADEAATVRQFLIDNYGFDPGGLGQNSRETPSDKVFGRVDVNLNDSHQLTLRHNYVDAANDINRPNSFTHEWPSETYQITNETNSTVVQLNSVFGSNQFNEFRLTYQTISDRRGGRGGLQFPWIEIENVIDTQTGDDLGEWEMGTEPFSTRNALDQDILEITNDFTWLKGDHTFTIGTHNELFTFDNLFIQNAFGSYEFSTQQDLFDGIARRFNFTQVVPGQPERQMFDVNQLGFYVGDQWAFRPDVTFTYGLRVDVPFFPDTPADNPFTRQTYGFATSEIPDGNYLWQPRFGFNWDISGDGSQQLRGGTGIFAGRAPYVWISNNYARTGLEQIFITQFGVPFNPDPFGQTIDPDAPTAIGEFNLIDPDFEFPQVWRTNIAYDRELPWWGLIGSVELVYSDSIEEIDYKNLNIVQNGTLPFDGRPTFTQVDPGVDGAYLITNSGIGDATNLAIKLERPYRDGISGFVSYAYGEANVVNDGSSSRAVSNWQFTEAVDPNNVGESPSDFEVEHRFNASFSYTEDWGGNGWDTTFSAFYNLQSGRPFSYLVGDAAFPFDSINEDGFGFNDLMYVPTGPDDVVTTRGSYEQLDAYIQSQECLRSRRGQIAPRNCANAPWIHQFDIRIAQDIPIGKSGRHFQLTFDLLNATNLLDEDSGVLRYVQFGTVTPVEYVGLTDDGKPIYELQRIVTDPDNNSQFETHNIRSRWRAKLGVRFTF
ncbi:MAG: TonB-dependent receptor [Thermoanaerobaculia bacterium]|nr:TonB-dependent receptor [Thermoanaerobaculia bacterium]